MQGQLTEEEKLKGLPFSNEKIPVGSNSTDLLAMIEAYPGFKFCIYLADKTSEEWDESTSRVYMNQILPGFIYYPMNVGKDDLVSLSKVYEFAMQNAAVVAINHTKPHKNNRILRQMFCESGDTFVDVLVKDDDNKFKPYDLNGPAFVDAFIYDNMLGTFKGMHVVIIGAGGAGEAIAREIIKRGAKISFIDPLDKRNLISTIGDDIIWYSSIYNFVGSNANLDGIILINCSGRGVSPENPLEIVFAKGSGAFVDIRAQMDLDTVMTAEGFANWKCATGFAMNARNDYVLLKEIANRGNMELPIFSNFRAIVAAAS